MSKFRKITMEELVDHNNKQSFWLLIEEKIYDVTKYLNEHPGGEAVVLKHADAVGHCDDFQKLLEDYQIGELSKSTVCCRRCILQKLSTAASFFNISPQYIIPIILVITSFIIYKYYM